VVLRHQFGSHRRVLMRIVVLGGALAALLVQSGMPPAAAASAGNPNLLQNGCLTDPQIPAGSATSVGFSGKSSQLPGWTESGQPTVVANSAYQPSALGCPDFVFLDANDSISQVVSTTPGFRYLLQWDLNAHHWGAYGPRSMQVFWEGRVVASRTFNYTSVAPPWASEQVMVTATEKQSDLTLQDTTDSNGEAVSTVAVTAATEVVNGFAVSSSSGVYASTVRQMASKIPGTAVVTASGTPVCTLQAADAEQVNSGTGLLIIWTIAPTSQFLKEPSATRQAKAQVVETYLVGLLKRSRNLYVGLLQAARIPPQGDAWWGVEVQSTSTTGSPMSFETASAGTKTTMTWSNVPGVTSTAPALAAEALANLLYYTKSIATLPA